MMNTRKLFNDFLHLLYPHNCAGCGSDLLENDQEICMHCYAVLPETNFAAFAGNPIEKIFYGRLPVELATAGYYFNKQTVLQRLVHQLKYKGNKEVGWQLGKWLGLQLKSSNRFNGIDALVPLPLFPDKEKRRGYNQSTILCEGIADVLQLPVLNNAVIRKHYTDTQTKKGRSDRWTNVDNSFAIANAELLANKHVLLVDDVITTGATLEACGTALKTVQGLTLSIAALTCD
jgi:ComF family protein